MVVGFEVEVGGLVAEEVVVVVVVEVVVVVGVAVAVGVGVGGVAGVVE
jgi:hypothetical protein